MEYELTLTEAIILDQMIDQIIEDNLEYIDAHQYRIAGEKGRYYFYQGILVKDKIIGYNLYSLTGNNQVLVDQINLERFKESGGYTKIISTKLNEQIENETRRKVELEKLILENKHLSWQTKTFWPLFIFSIIGGICGLISFILTLLK